MSLHNPFLWRENPRPSIFLADGDSATRSRRASQAVDRKTAATGKNPGTLDLRRSPRSDKAYMRKTGVR